MSGVPASCWRLWQFAFGSQCSPPCLQWQVRLLSRPAAVGNRIGCPRWLRCGSTTKTTMARILITSGPTRQYLDPVRYLTNASSGRMGRALAEAALELGHEVLIVSGPVAIDYPAGAKIRQIVSTDDLLTVCQELFPACDGVIGAAAPCDYRPVRVEERKIAKTGQPMLLNLVETPDVMATLGASKRPEQWLVGFALETDD